MLRIWRLNGNYDSNHQPLALREVLLALWRVVPPRARFLTRHEAGHRHKHIDHTRIMARRSFLTQRLIHLKRVATDELGGCVNAQQLQIPGAGGANIGKVGQRAQARTVNFVGMHGGVWVGCAGKR